MALGTSHIRRAALTLLSALWMVPAVTAAADPVDKVRLELHFKPVSDTQIAVWLETVDGQFVQDVFVSQATGKLGIANRPGRWDFVSSWRAPYGARPMVLPVWAHRRAKVYPKIVFFDDDIGDQDSLGWHEDSSSEEKYFCRPLMPNEHETISTDTMTCPSPAVFQTDKGQFHATDISVYPPRNDLVTFEEGQDSADARTYAELNDLDVVTGATPPGGQPTFVTALVPSDTVAAGPLVAWIEVSLEHDENPYWEFDRTDHFIDPRLEQYGVEYFGQPSVVYRIEFDGATIGFTGTSRYVGYGDWNGATGKLHPADDTISERDGSGADRLQRYTLNGATFRFGVFSSGLDPDAVPPDGWGNCKQRQLPALEDLELEPIAFDRVRAHFTVPIMDEDIAVERIQLYYHAGEMTLTEDTIASAIERVPEIADCGPPMSPGTRTWCDIDELFGDFTYQVGVRYEDGCANVSALASAAIRTPRQQFAQVESFCVVASAAYGAPWSAEVGALRWFRDAYLLDTGVGQAFVRFYYAHGPSFAPMIAKNPYARAVSRVVLKPMADTARLVVSRR